MEEEYVTLQTIFDIVKDDLHPDTYLCSAREIILRQPIDWDIIQRHLELLADRELIVVKKLDKIAISITRRGLEHVKSLNPVTDHAFSYTGKSGQL